MVVVVRGTPRTDLAIVDGLAKLGSATVHEAQGRIGMLHHRLRPIFPTAVAGNALTCEVAPGDNWSIHIAVEQAREGDILVRQVHATTAIWATCWRRALWRTAFAGWLLTLA